MLAGLEHPSTTTHTLTRVLLAGSRRLDRGHPGIERCRPGQPRLV